MASAIMQARPMSASTRRASCITTMSAQHQQLLLEDCLPLLLELLPLLPGPGLEEVEMDCLGESRDVNGFKKMLYFSFMLSILAPRIPCGSGW